MIVGIGKIAREHGIKGDVIIVPYAVDSDHFHADLSVTIKHPLLGLKETTLKNLSEIIKQIEIMGSIVLLVDLQDDVYKPLSKKYHTAYVSNILEGIYGNPSLMSDSLHPNDAGYKIMAERIAPVLKRVSQ